MKSNTQRGKRIFANPMHRDICTVVFWAALLPSVIVSVALFYLIFKITADQIGFPEAIGYHIIPAAHKVVTIVLLCLPLTISIILLVAHKLSHKIVGPYDRIVRELGEYIAGSRQGPIVLRKNDKFQPLVDKINILLERLKN